ncbi:hypothetical protein NVV95_11165 [Herbiconiux sp. CPCC 205716]|uniref:Uncharacterized protein n=1 Tax=Herbiconiux gentiana TaxID=2970912 RepID=A0ABT2GJZ9_9MICO|nr:hypothetical protein [Herbiconiux gentiana]MCS5715111.1 hypothetical protein [Herbiconiux gentiana]
MTGTDNTTGTVTIGRHTLTLPEEQARALFLAAGYASKRSAALVISPDITTVVKPGTEVSITITGGFTEEHDPTRAGVMRRM